MDKYYVVLEDADNLRLLNFREKCLRGINPDGQKIESIWPIDFNGGYDYISVPFYWQVFDWFKDVYGLDSWIIPCVLQDKVAHSFRINRVDYSEQCYATKEEAQLECLKELISTIKSYTKKEES
jgi:hypothetical protein